MQPVIFKLFHNFQKYEIKGKFKGLLNINDDIFSQLINQPNHEYYVKSEVSEETFSSFIEYWVREKPPLITFNNLYEYEKLSEEFQIMREIIEKVTNSFDECEMNLYKLQHMTNVDKKTIEQNISKRLDSYIEEQGDKLMSLDIQTLYNIFSSAEGKFSKHNEAYELIKKHYSKNKDDQIFILLPILEGEKLNYSNLKETIYESKKRYGFVPKKEISFYDDLLNKIDKLLQINEEQNKKIEELEKEHNKEKEEQNKKFEELQKEIKELKEIKEKQDSEITKIKQENQTIIQKQEDKIKRQQEKEKIKNNDPNEQKQKAIKPKVSKIDQEKNLVKKHVIKSFPFLPNNEFKGIINYLKSNSKNIYNEINITSSSIFRNDEQYSPRNSIRFDDPNAEFCSDRDTNSWLCFDFKTHRIIPKNYTIRSYKSGSNNQHPRSWVIEGSNDEKQWEIIDEEKDCSLLNGENFVHTFNISNPTNKEYQFVRMRKTGPDWYNGNYLNINCIEFYGLLI